MKPIKRGYKVWCRADSQTGCLIEFQVYEGKSADRPANVGLGEHVVLSLIDGVEAGTQLYFDNLFHVHTPKEALKEKNILAAGTVRPNRKDLPDEIKRDNKLQKVQDIWWTKGSITAYQWRDTKNVHVLSNFHPPSDTEDVVRKLSNDSSISVQCPKAVSDYNNWMGGVDKFDQRRNAYPVDRRCKKSWYRIFYFLPDAAMANAFLQMKAVSERSYFGSGSSLVTS
ncbi:hypothetical protein HPB51_020402 [Rhipicephalus microplus]|uniref:PiggyBac transposable element-derived protein domain-containing protein n=1 Tax=Rhipicephalus microplus TaxID=6941 RepID=A0A9J6DWY8_RHIMP|nr:hypothetical protein HPB51_020402 [Rhipicephalus microplus]